MMAVHMVTDTVSDYVLHELTCYTGKAHWAVILGYTDWTLFEDWSHVSIFPAHWKLTSVIRNLENKGQNRGKLNCKLF